MAAVRPSPGLRLAWGPATLAGPAALILAAVALGVATAFQPLLVLGGVAGTLVVAWLVARPVRGVYLLLLVAPLTVGMNRGLVAPLLRPNEALFLLVAGIVVLVGAVAVESKIRAGPFGTVDAALLVLFVFGSVTPLAVMLARSTVPTVEDVFLTFAPLKYYLAYRLILAAVPGRREMLLAAYVMIAASVVVSIIGLLQIGRLFDTHEWLATFYSSGHVRESLVTRRATSTVGVWQALAGYLAIHAVLGVALLQVSAVRGAWQWLLVAAIAVDILGTLATATLTGVVALLIGFGAIALFGRQLGRTMLIAVPVMLVSAVLLWPLVEERWAYQFTSWGASGDVPVTWEVRVRNLTDVFWPSVQDDLLFGVRPSLAPELGGKYPENQVMFLLYQGGLLYVGAYLVFMALILRAAWAWLRRLDGPSLAVGRAAFIAWLLIAVLGIFDSHLTMAGEADAAWALLALAAGACAARARGEEHEARRERAISPPVSRPSLLGA